MTGPDKMASTSVLESPVFLVTLAIFASVLLQQHSCLQHTSTSLFRPQQWEACSSGKTYCPATGVCASLLEVVRMRLRQQHDLRGGGGSVEAAQLPDCSDGRTGLLFPFFLPIKCFYCVAVEANTFNDPINFKLTSSLHRGCFSGCSSTLLFVLPSSWT